jgi:hypothetical protein
MQVLDGVKSVFKSIWNSPGEVGNFVTRVPGHVETVYKTIFDDSSIILPEHESISRNPLKDGGIHINPNFVDTKNLHKLYLDCLIVDGINNIATRESTDFEKLICPADYVHKSFSQTVGKFLGGILGFTIDESNAYFKIAMEGARNLRDSSIELVEKLAKASLVFAHDGYAKLQIYLALIGAMTTVLTVDEDGQKAASELGLARNIFQWNAFKAVGGTLLKVAGAGLSKITR